MDEDRILSVSLHAEVSLGSAIEGVIQRPNQSEMGQSACGKLRISIRKHSVGLDQFNFNACTTKPDEFGLLAINRT